MRAKFLVAAIAIAGAMIGVTGAQASTDFSAPPGITNGADPGSSATAPAEPLTTCTPGYSWGEYHKLAIPSGSLSATVYDESSSTPSGTGTTGKWAHVVARVGFQDFNGFPEIQDGIEAQNGAAPTFYEEESGGSTHPAAGTGPGTGWFSITQDGHVFWDIDFGAPDIGTGYTASVTNNGGGNYTATVGGYTSPSIPLGTISHPDSTYTNEIYANNTGTCPALQATFSNLSPYSESNYAWKQSGVTQDFSTSYVEGFLNIDFPG